MLNSKPTDDIGPPTNTDSADGSLDRHRSPFINFFVSFWTRIKLLFTTTLAEICDCSVAPKNRPSPIKDADDCTEETVSHLNKAPPSGVDQDLSKRPFLHPLDEEQEAEDSRFIQLADSKSTNAAAPTLLRETFSHLENSFDSLDSSDSIAEEHLEPVVLTGDVLFSTAVTFVHPKMMTSVEPQTYHSTLFQVAEKSHVFEVPPETEEEGIVEENDLVAESICSLSEISKDAGAFRPITILGRLHAKLRNGDLTLEQYDEVAATVIASTIPRNLSDSVETRKPHGANQLYAWQIPPPLPELNLDENTTLSSPEAKIDTSNPGAFVDSLISDAVKVFSQERESGGSEKKSRRKNQSFVDRLNFNLSTDDNSFYYQIPPASDISYDGLQTSSLDRVRSTTVARAAATARSKRSSSLKSERSPDETPCRKIVRFADSLGLDLATVRQVKDTDNPPSIPASATLDLNLDTEKSFSSLGAKQFQLCFSQPSTSASFMHRVLTSFVCLENARVDSSRGLLTGTIRVRSIGFEKKVAVRISYNNWSTYFEIPASYVQDSHDGTTDRFSFSAVFPSSMVANDKAQFAVRYETHAGTTYWDNNHGENYVILCHAKATDVAGDGSWIHYL